MATKKFPPGSSGAGKLQHPHPWNEKTPEMPNAEQRAHARHRLDMQVNGSESDVLSASEIACAVADAWAATHPDTKEFTPKALVPALDRLEAATRGSALRKVRP